MFPKVLIKSVCYNFPTLLFFVVGGLGTLAFTVHVSSHKSVCYRSIKISNLTKESMFIMHTFFTLFTFEQQSFLLKQRSPIEIGLLSSDAYEYARYDEEVLCFTALCCRVSVLCVLMENYHFSQRTTLSQTPTFLINKKIPSSCISFENR